MARRISSPFETLRTEGGLLPPDLLKRVADGDKDLPGLAPADYHLFEGERLGEATSRAWNRLLGAWASFREASEKLAPGAADAGMTRERWLAILFQELGYGRLEPAPRATELGDKTYPISHFWQRSSIHLVGFRTDLDTRTKGVAGAARQSPHSLVQEFLNRSDEHLWGLVSNGLRLRLLRDNVSLTRPAYVEFDLEAMMVGEAYADFALLWLVAHESRLEPRPAAEGGPARPEGCWLEAWTRVAQERGTRALDQLRGGVEKAIASLGRGFLAHRANAALRESLRSGKLGAQDYYRELLRLVYRLLFLFTAEDRGVLLLPEAETKPEARRRFLEHYSTRHLRQLAERRRGGPHADLYQGLRLVMEKLGDDRGCPELALPALGSFLWSKGAVPHLAGADIANRQLLEAVRALAFTEAERRPRPVDYRNLGAEELGSIYESLLELHPEVDTGAAHFELRTAAGHERKTTGSYYTPTSLINCLLETALDPVLDEAQANPDPEAAIQALKVCDPAVGSGHFLIAAAHRIARRLAFVRTGEEEPAPEALRTALRDVIGRCLYGVDLNPMAVELCKVSLWLEALEPGKPLSFLDHHVQCGNSLLGATPALLARGIPDDAFKAIEGDDKEVASALRKQNREERKGQTSLFAAFVRDATPAYGSLAEAVAGLDALPDDSPAAVHEKEERWRRLAASEEARRERLRADAWCAAFVWPKRDGAPEGPTHDLFLRLAKDPAALPRATREEVERTAREYRFFHWHLAFPDVFRVPEDGPRAGDVTGWAGGFDVVLSNPPWERIKLQEKEFFATRNPEIANAPNAAARRRLIEELANDDEGKALYDAFLAARRQAEGESHLVRDSGRYPLCGRGDVNTYTIFSELLRGAVAATGRVGCIVPSGIATDDTTKHFFQDLAAQRALASLFDFQSGPGLFAEIGHARYKFCLLTLVGSARAVPEAEFAFFLRSVDHLGDPERRFRLSAEDIALLNPNTKTCPVFRTRRAAELTKQIYRRVPILIREGPPEESSWVLLIRRIFDMNKQDVLAACSTDAHTGSPTPLLPMYEAKLVHQFHHRFGDYADRPANSVSTTLPDVPSERLANAAYLPRPRYWIPEPEVEARLVGRWPQAWFLGWRDICRSTDERTVIASILPRAGTDFTIRVAVQLAAPNRVCILLAGLNSFPLDFVARQKIGGTHLSDYITLQLPVPAPSHSLDTCQWDAKRRIGEWVTARVLELTYTAWDLAPFARDLGYDGPPFRWDEERRFLLRCELDAAFFYLYGIAHDDVGYIMDTFPIVKRKDEATHAHYRTRDTILEIYDALQKAIDTGEPYQTRLDPPPADPRVAHPVPADTPAPEKLRRLVRVPGDRDKRYVDRVPLVSVKAAAGIFAGGQVSEFRDWVRVKADVPLAKGMFVAQAEGPSMEPLIPTDAYCLFQGGPPRNHWGSVVLAQIRELGDPEEGGQYAVKCLTRGPGGAARLESENPDYPPFDLDPEEKELRVIGTFVQVVGHELE
jgi:SOS-response transcriptional repressor LexA